MKKTAMVTLFSFFMVVLAVVFGNTHSASAHEMYTTTAQQASESGGGGTMEAMRNFVLHVKEHREAIRTDDGHAEFRNAMRTDGSDWKHGNTYVIAVNTGAERNYDAGDIIIFHAEHPLATDKSLRSIEIFRELMTKVEMLGEGEKAACVEDETGRYGNHICAAITTLTSGAGFTNNVISVVGFHHEEGEADDSLIRCDSESEYAEYFSNPGTDSNEEEFNRTRADMVTDRESLENYLKTVEEMISNRIDEIKMAPGYEELRPLQQRAVITQGLVRSRPCWRQEPWTSGSIYFYLIRYAQGKGVATQHGIFNGLSPQFEDTTLLLYDGCIDVGQTVFQKLQEDPPDGFLEYYWSNPVKDNDRVVDASGNPIRGLSPGTSVKLGYFLTTNFRGGTRSEFVIGSGIYPEDKEYYVPESGMCQDHPDYLTETARQHLDKFPKAPEQKKDDDGGCAIASGTQGNLKVAGLNLLLITLVTFFAISRKSRSGRKFWTWEL